MGSSPVCATSSLNKEMESMKQCFVDSRGRLRSLHKPGNGYKSDAEVTVIGDLFSDEFE